MNKNKKDYVFKYRKNSNCGFTLIETLVSLMILSLVITSIVSLLSSSIYSARYAKNETKAIYIAQEGIDYIRNLRDSIAFQQNDWTSFSSALDSNCSGAGCIINRPFLINHFLALDVSPAPVGQILDGEFRNTIYSECVNLVGICDAVKIRSLVEWKNGSLEKSKELQVTLTMWN